MYVLEYLRNLKQAILALEPFTVSEFKLSENRGKKINAK